MDVSKLRDAVDTSTVKILDNYAEYLQLAARLYNYNADNVILVFLQFPTATCVAGYNAWKHRFHRDLKSQQEKAIALIKPTTIKKEVSTPVFTESGEPQINEKQQIEYENNIAPVLDYDVAFLFDISQTVPSGDEAPEVEQINKTIDVKTFSRIFRKKTDYTVSFIDDTDTLMPRHQKYKMIFMDEELVIRKDLPDEITAQCYIKAFAEYLCKDEKKTFSNNDNMNAFMVQAASYIVCSYFNIDVSQFSFPYAPSLRDESPENILYFLRGVQNKALTIIQTFNQHVFSFDDINLINQLVNTYDKNEFLDELEDIKNNSTDKYLIKSLDSLRDKIDRLSATEFVKLFKIRNSQQLFTQPTLPVTPGNSEKEE